ncbi:hypothetical protein LLG96_06755 [bacterium]|nr:hypothetical protein [bacterium]
MKSLRTLHAAVWIAVLSLLLAAGVSYAAGNHTPVFTWQHRGGAVNPEQWIYDGDIPIALFEQRIIEQPAEQLMFFNMVSKPPLLRHLRLTPDGAPLVEAVQLYCKCGHIVTDRLLDLDIEGQGTDRLTVTFVTGDQTGIATSKRILTLTWDSGRETYVYDFQVELTFNSPELFNDSPPSVEFADPWLTGCPGPALEFTGMWQKRYQRFVYEAQNGTVCSIPVNHFVTSHKGGIRLKRDGMFLTAFEPDGNPAIQFVGDTAEKSSIGICWWGYDLHLSRAFTADELFSSVRSRYRIFRCPAQQAEALLKAGVVPPLRDNELKGKKELPVYERISTFDKGLRLVDSYPGKTDPFPWLIEGNGAEWDRTSGRNDSYSLKISKKEPGLTRWRTSEGDGEGYYMEPWTPCKGFRVSCWVKTDTVTGRGSTLAVQYHVPNSPQIYPILTAKRLTGTNGWTKLEIEVPQPVAYPREIGCLMFMLQQDGSGTTWFDDMEVQFLQ